MRTQKEIADKVREESSKFLSFVSEVLIGYLDFEHAREFLKPEVKTEEWTVTPLSREAVVEEMRVYMAEYGWDKALNHRGISAGRTVQKMGAWAWLIEDSEAEAFADNDDNYPPYGGPVLRYLCERYGFPIPDSEEARRMGAGLSCEPGCDDGCSR